MLYGGGNVLKLRYYRELKGMTLEELGKIVGVTDGTISNYERGTRRPNYEMLLKLSEALGTDVSHLLGTAPDDDVAEYLEELRERPETRMLLRASRGMTKENIDAIVKLMETFK